MTELGEPTHIAEERETIQKTLLVLRKAQKVLKRDPDLASGSKFISTEDSKPAEKKKESSLFGK